MRRWQESPEQRRQARQEADRQQRQRQAQFHSQRLSLDKFKSDLLIQLDHCAVCNSIAFVDKTKKVSNTTLLEICPEFQPEHAPESVLCSKCNTQTSKGAWPSWATNNHLSPDDIPKELASLSSDEVSIDLSFPQSHNPTRWSIWRRRQCDSLPFPSPACHESAATPSE